MLSFALRQVALCSPLILGYLPLAAQNSSCYLEFESRDLVLVNNSEKSIEAYSVRQTCGTGGQFTAATLYTGLHHGTSGVIQSGERRNLGGGWANRPDDPACDALLEAVIFIDGSFEGKEAAVRSLKAQSDGIAASVNYWVDGTAETEHRLSRHFGEIRLRATPRISYTSRPQRLAFAELVKNLCYSNSTSARPGLPSLPVPSQPHLFEESPERYKRDCGK